MKDEKQLVLFFRKGTEIDNTLLASNLSSKFPTLKDPIVLPFDENNPGRPLVAFEQGTIKLSIYISDISFAYLGEEHKNVYDTVIEIIEYLEYLDLSFERMGYITTFLHNEKEKETFKKNVFNENLSIGSEFQVSWYKRELIDSVSVNVWIKGITDMLNHVDFVSIYDINTPIDEVYNISSDFLRDFLKQCDRYIEEKEKIIK